MLFRSNNFGKDKNCHLRPSAGLFCRQSSGDPPHYFSFISASGRLKKTDNDAQIFIASMPQLRSYDVDISNITRWKEFYVYCSVDE